MHTFLIFLFFLLTTIVVSVVTGIIGWQYHRETHKYLDTSATILDSHLITEPCSQGNECYIVSMNVEYEVPPEYGDTYQNDIIVRFGTD